MNFNGIDENFAFMFVGYLVKIVGFLIIFGHFNKRIQKSINKTSYGYRSAVYYWTTYIRKKVAEFFNCKYSHKEGLTSKDNTNSWDFLGVIYGCVMMSPMFILIPFTLALGYWQLTLTTGETIPSNLGFLSTIEFMIIHCDFNPLGICFIIVTIFCVTSLITGISFTFTDLKKSWHVIVCACLALASFDHLIPKNNFPWNGELMKVTIGYEIFIYLAFRWLMAILWTFRRSVDDGEIDEEQEQKQEQETESGQAQEEQTQTEPQQTQAQTIIQSASTILETLANLNLESFSSDTIRRQNGVSQNDDNNQDHTIHHD